MATEQERKDKVKAEDLQKAVIIALQTVEDVCSAALLVFPHICMNRNSPVSARRWSQ